MLMRLVQQNVLLIQNSVPDTFVTDPELKKATSSTISVMTHSLDQKVLVRRAKARKCTAEIVGNIQEKVEISGDGFCPGWGECNDL
jgi:ribosomal protein L21